MSAEGGGQPARIAIVLWGVLGVVGVLAEAIHRLAARALSLLDREELTTGHLSLIAIWTVVICYFEGYRGFQHGFSPRVVARAFHLAEHPRPLHVGLAPLFCMALFHTTRRRLIATWVLLVGIVALVLLVRQLPPLYRAIVDGGVACALAWGTIAMVVYLIRGLSGRPMPVPPDVVEESALDTAAGMPLSQRSAGPGSRV